MMKTSLPAGHESVTRVNGFKADPLRPYSITAIASMVSQPS